MSRNVHCVVLDREAEGLERPPIPGELGQRIYDHVSKEGWQQWLERLQMIINEEGLSTSDPRAMDQIQRHMLGFFFGEGEYGGLPAGYRPKGSK